MTIHGTSRGSSSLGTAPDRQREILARQEAATLAGPRLMENIDALASVSPRLRGTLPAGFAGPVAHRAGGYRGWALLALAVLMAIGDTGDQLEIYLEAALRHGATDEEILDVSDVVCAYAGAPRAVNAARVLGERLVPLRTRRPPGTVQTVVSLGGHETRVRDSGAAGGHGDGVPILLIHALSTDHRFWRGVWPQLAGLGRVVAYDIRGHGSARGAAPTTGLDQLADDAAALLDRLGIPAADVYGASYGGAIAQHLALGHPDRVRSPALIATASKSPRETLEQRAKAAEQHGMEAQVPVSLQRWFLPDTIAADTWVARYARESVRRNRAEDWAGAWRAMARLDVLDRLSEIDVPTVAIAGAQDVSATPPDMRRTADGIPGAEYTLIDPGTHMMPLEQPDALAAELRRFRRSTEGAGSTVRQHSRFEGTSAASLAARLFTGLGMEGDRGDVRA